MRGFGRLYLQVLETFFDAVYLVSVIIGILMIRGCKGNHSFHLFGLMAVVLGAGDSFHLVPRALAPRTKGLDRFDRLFCHEKGMLILCGLPQQKRAVTMTALFKLLYR